MDTFAMAAFGLSALFLAYASGGFVVLVAAVGVLRRRRVRTAPVTPTVTVIIAAYNEEAVIAERLENALALDYPRDRLQVLVACDGCSDATADVARSYEPRGVRVLSLPRRGKIPTLNHAVRHATGEVLVFSDANAMCDSGALRALVRNFADPAVGGVAGRTSYCLEAASESIGRGERLYWDYDTRLKVLEARTGNVVSAHGALYAVRRALYREVPDAAVTDDFAISTGVIAQGYRLVFEPEAHATEFAVPAADREFRRRVRLMTRGLRGVLLRRALLNPFRYGFYSFVLFSHKVARRLIPAPLAVIAVTSAYLSPRHPVFAALTAGQASFYALALAGYLLRRHAIGSSRLLYVPFYFCTAILACALACTELLRGRRVELWQPQRHPQRSARAGTGAAR